MKPWAFRQIKPQKARGTMSESLWTDPDWIAEEKFDGDRRIAQFCGKVVRFTGCRESVDGTGFVEKTENVPHLSGKGVRRVKLPASPPGLDGTVLDGEMIASVLPDGRAPLTTEGMSKFVTSIMGSLPEEAVRKQIERGWLRYVVFDCLFYKGKDVRQEPLENRQSAARAAVNRWANPFVSIVDGWRMNKRIFYEDVVKRGGEGVILKHRDHRYGDEKLWVKVKHEHTADVVILGFTDAKELSKKKGEDVATLTKYAKAGLIGAIVCGQHKHKVTEPARLPTVEVATVSGMTDDLRRDFTQAPGAYTGKVIEIKHNGREPTGRFRHPRFVRFRPDKSAKDCVYDLEER